jgi:hypothetical protein
MLVISLYEVGSTFVAPQSLTVDEALDLHRRGVLVASDFGFLSEPARDAITAASLKRLDDVRPRNGFTFVKWGVKRLTRAFIGRA